MSLVPKRKMTEKRLAARRIDRRKAHGLDLTDLAPKKEPPNKSLKKKGRLEKDVKNEGTSQ